MITITYNINGAKFQRRYDDTARQRALVWSKAATLIFNGVRVRIKMSNPHR